MTAPAYAIAVEDLEPLRRPLTGYCYRLLGGSHETEDAVQETFLRAVRNADRFDRSRGTLKTWLFAIATNICLDLLRGARRRAVAVDLGPAATGPGFGAPVPADQWVEPMPDASTLDATDPAELAAQRQTIRLAFVAALQYLPPRQRAVLVLRDILAFSAAETAELLETSVPAVTSALQRARSTLDTHRPRPADVVAPADADQLLLLERYLTAFENHDVAGLRAVLREDAIATMPPFAWWLQGRELLATLMTSGGCDGDRLLPTVVNGCPGFGQYRPDDDGVLRPFALVGMELHDGGVSCLTTFLGSAPRFTEFGLPEVFTPHR